MRSFSLLLALVAVLAVFVCQPALAFVSCDINYLTIKADNQVVYAGVQSPYHPNTYVNLVNDLVSDVLWFNASSDARIFYYTKDGTFTVYYNTSVENLGTPVVVKSPPWAQPFTTFSVQVNKQCDVLNAVAINLFQNKTTSESRQDWCNHTYIQYIQNKPCHGIVGDPQFAGLRGQSFQVHGIDGAIYSLISAPAYLMNSQFRFLESPRPCAVMPSTGLRSTACWSHPGSYLGSIGARTTSGDVFIATPSNAQVGFDSVTFNGASVSVGSARVFADGLGYLVRNSTHELTLQLGVFTMEIENNNEFLNVRTVRVSRSAWSELSSQRVHGLLGQTWSSRQYTGSVKDIEGEIDDYVISGESLTGADFVFSRFGNSDS